MATPTLTAVDGFEHQTLVANSGGFFNSVTGITTIDTTVARTGAASLKVAGDGVTSAKAIKPIKTAATVLVGSCYVRLTANPGTTTNILVGLGPVSNKPLIQVGTGGFIQEGIGSNNGPNIIDGLWHKVDFRFTSTTTHSVEWYVDGVQQTTGSIAAQTSTAMDSIQFGSASSAANGIVWFDDFILSNTSADYPLLPSNFADSGDGYVVRQIVPTADGTHNAGVNVMERQSDLVDIGVTTAWDMLDEWPAVTTTSDTIIQSAIGTGNYAEVALGDTLPADRAIWGATGQLVYLSTGSPANSGATVASWDGFTTEQSIFGTSAVPVDMSITTATSAWSTLVAPAGGWTLAAVDAAKIRVGFSGDVSPNPLWCAVGIQYAALDRGRGRPSPAQSRQAVKRASVF